VTLLSEKGGMVRSTAGFDEETVERRRSIFSYDDCHKIDAGIVKDDDLAMLSQTLDRPLVPIVHRSSKMLERHDWLAVGVGKRSVSRRIRRIDFVVALQP
jgi:hypothetical protein